MDDSIILNLVKQQMDDKVLELKEHLAYELELVTELQQLMDDWAGVL